MPLQVRSWLWLVFAELFRLPVVQALVPEEAGSEGYGSCRLVWSWLLVAVGFVVVTRTAVGLNPHDGRLAVLGS